MLGYVHGGLLIEMEDNVYCKSNDRLFSVIAFFMPELSYYPPSIKLLSHPQAEFLSIQRGESS
jgi:hypothetical protein